MYYPFGREVTATSYFSFSSWASSQFLAFIKETLAGSSMDAPIYSASTQQGIVDGIDYGINLLQSDVFLDNQYSFWQLRSKS